MLEVKCQQLLHKLFQPLFFKEIGVSNQMKLSTFSIHFFQIYLMQNVLSKKGNNLMMGATINASPATWQTNMMTLMEQAIVFVWIASIYVINFMKWNMSGTVVSSVIVEIQRRKKESVSFQKVFINLKTIEIFWKIPKKKKNNPLNS